MTQTEMIEEVLTHRYDCPTGSAITQAVAYCIFGAHSSTLVGHMDNASEFEKAVTPAMVREAVDLIEHRMRGLRATLNKMTDLPPQLGLQHGCGGNEPLIPGSRYCH